MYMCECVHIARNPKRDYMNLGKIFEKEIFGSASKNPVVCICFRRTNADDL